MRSVWNGTIGKGLLNIGIKLYCATESENNGISFNCFSPKNNPVGYKWYDKVTNELVEYKDLKKGIKVDEKTIVTFDKEELKNIELNNTNLEIIGLKNRNELDLRLYDDGLYYSSPDEKQQYNYALFREILRNIHSILIVKGVIRGKESFFACYPHNKSLVFQKLRTMEMIRDIDKLEIEDIDIKANEIQTATKMFQKLCDVRCDLQKLRSEYAKRLEKFVKDKIEGKKIVVKQTKTKTEGFMDMLKAEIGE